MRKNFFLAALVAALLLCACEKSAEDRINGTWKSVDAGNYFQVLLKIDTKARTGRLEKFDGDEIVVTHEEKIVGVKENGNAVTLEMEDPDGVKSEITLTMEGGKKMILSGSGESMAFTKVKK